MNISQRNLCAHLYSLGLAANAPLDAGLHLEERSVVEAVRHQARQQLAALLFEPREVDTIEKVVELVESGQGVRDVEPAWLATRPQDAID